MNTQEECQELLMQDVVRIDFMPTTALNIGIPFSIPNITSVAATMADGSELTDERLFAASLLSLNMIGEDTSDAEMEEGVSHKVTEKRDVAGTIRTHTLQIPIEIGFQAIRDKEAALQAADFNIVLTTGDDDRYLVYALPGSSSFSVDEQMGQAVQMTVKASVQSMSGLIKILAEA